MTDQALHAVAHILLRLCSPRRACLVLGHLGALLPSHHHPSDLLRARDRIGRKGTCLSRALALAARSPRAEVVIAVTPSAFGRISAHAWVELSHDPIDPSEVSGEVIARIGPRRWS